MKIKPLAFFIACLALCLIPTIGFFFFPTTETTENHSMSELPALIEDGRLNDGFSDEFDAYFNEHMGLRNLFVAADARIQETLFGVSNVDGVIVGSSGWLYYSATLNDYLGTDILSERDLFNLAHNLSVVSDYLAEKEVGFLVIIPPNKNTLYGSHMPYYDQYIVDEDHNALLLEGYLADASVPYLDLFSFFASQDEVLYLERDSHWNTKAACLVYDMVMDCLELPHEEYTSEAPVLAMTHDGDLDRMLHSFYGTKENDYTYSMKDGYRYTKEDADVQDGWLITENPDGSGTLLMFRDSFADNLIPFFSDEFAFAYYSKGIPGHLERYLETYDPDCVVVEKVERNITDYLYSPPIISPVSAALPSDITIADTNTTITLTESEFDMNYYLLSGTIDPERVETNSEVLISVNGAVYRAYQTGGSNYALYLKKADLAEDIPLTIRVYVLSGDLCTRVLAEELPLPKP